MRPRPPRGQQRLLLFCPQPRVVSPEKVRQEFGGECSVVNLAGGARGVRGGREVVMLGGVPMIDHACGIVCSSMDTGIIPTCTPTAVWYSSDREENTLEPHTKNADT